MPDCSFAFDGDNGQNYEGEDSEDSDGSDGAGCGDGCDVDSSEWAGAKRLRVSVSGGKQMRGTSIPPLLLAVIAGAASPDLPRAAAGAALVEVAEGIQDTQLNLLQAITRRHRHLLPPGVSFAVAYPPLLPSFAAVSSVVALAPPTLEALVERLTLPGRATDDTNDVCAAILLHPELSKNPSIFSMYSKMNGGLRNYSTGTAHAWLYMPRKRPIKPCKPNDSDLDYVSDSLALVFVYPDEHVPAAGNDEGEAAKPKSKLHFGGRAYPLCNNSVLLQHGAHKSFGCVSAALFYNYCALYLSLHIVAPLHSCCSQAQGTQIPVGC
jgi:hypothetical protein